MYDRSQIMKDALERVRGAHAVRAQLEAAGRRAPCLTRREMMRDALKVAWRGARQAAKDETEAAKRPTPAQEQLELFASTTRTPGAAPPTSASAGSSGSPGSAPRSDIPIKERSMDMTTPPSQPDRRPETRVGLPCPTVIDPSRDPALLAHREWRRVFQRMNAWDIRRSPVPPRLLSAETEALRNLTLTVATTPEGLARQVLGSFTVFGTFTGGHIDNPYDYRFEDALRWDMLHTILRGARRLASGGDG